MKTILFIGTNNFASSILLELIKKKINILYVITKPDKKMDRGHKEKSQPVKIIAEEHKIQYETQENINDKKTINFIKKIMPNLIIMIEYGSKLNNEIINIPLHGIINVHPSILPELRGPTPIQTAILRGYKETGISIIKINNKIDSGDILNINKCKINNNDNYISLFKKLIKLSVKGLMKTINDINNNNILFTKQDENKATYTYKFNKDFYKIDWRQNAIDIERKIKALTGIKLPYSFLNHTLIKIANGKSVKKKHNYEPGTIIDIKNNNMDVAAKDGILRINNIQIQGKTINNIENILNSKNHLFKIGNKFE